MMFNLFKEGGDKAERPFTLKQYEETMKWAAETIERIESYDVIDWMEAKEQDFFCTEICSVRKSCPNGVTKKTQRKKK